MAEQLSKIQHFQPFIGYMVHIEAAAMRVDNVYAALPVAKTTCYRRLSQSSGAYCFEPAEARALYIALFVGTRDLIGVHSLLSGTIVS
jgi:hypothetical protein